MNSEKPIISFREKPLQYICNEAYFGLSKKVFPNVNEERLAFWSGVVGGFVVAELGAHGVNPYVIQPIAAKLGINIPLDDIITYSMTGTASAGIIPKVIAPDAVKKWEQENPRYSEGVKGVMTGAMLAGALELFLMNYKG